jgi:4-diphosphocytidyl-2-C-methyl-D-erythritol kinase
MRARAFAKINLGLVVGPLRSDGKHEIATLIERVELHDVLELERTDGLETELRGFAEDTLIQAALGRLGAAASEPGGWRVQVEKRIPVAAGLGGGSSDAATALRLGNELLRAPLSQDELHALAAGVGSDVPFFLTAGAKLSTGDGTELEPIALPHDYWIVLALPHGRRKESTASVYGEVDATGSTEFEKRRRAFRKALHELEEPLQLAELPRNDLAVGAATSAVGDELSALGAFRVDVSGAGPTVYGLFELEEVARHAERSLRRAARTWLTRPVSGP